MGTEQDVPLQLADLAAYLSAPGRPITRSGVRWLIDMGRLPASRTPGGVRIVWKSDAEKFKARRDALAAIRPRRRLHHHKKKQERIA